MRVLFLNPVAHMGGAETSLIELMAGLRSAHPDWELRLLVSGEGPLVTRSEALGVRVTVLPFPAVLSRVGEMHARKRNAPALLSAAMGALAYGRRLRRAIQEIGPDIVHSNGMKMHLLAAAVLRKRMPLIWHMHDYLGQRRMMKRLLRACASRCTAIIANSRSVAADMSGMGISPRIVPIHNAVDFARFTPFGKSYDLDELSGMGPAPEGCLRIGLIATFARWKGHLTFLEAIGKLPRDPAFRAYIVGGPIYQTQGSQFGFGELKAAAEQFCPGRVGFTGLVDDAAMAIRALDVVVHASTKPEPFGMVIVEGMACGKAVVASRAGGSAEIFEDGRTAVGHESGDSVGLARQLQSLLGNSSLRKELGKAAREAAIGNFDRATMSAEVASLYGWCRAEAANDGRKWRAAVAAG